MVLLNQETDLTCSNRTGLLKLESLAIHLLFTELLCLPEGLGV